MLSPSCIALTSITIPGSVTKIGISAFDACTSLSSITIHDGITSIDNPAFLGCTAVTSITIPDSVTKIHKNAFRGCTSSLTQIISNNPDLIPDDLIQNRAHIQFISITDHLKQNHQDLFKVIESSEFKSNHVTSKELNLIIKLHQEDYLPNWNTIASACKERSMDQIRSLLHFFNKTIVCLILRITY